MGFQAVIPSLSCSTWLEVCAFHSIGILKQNRRAIAAPRCAITLLRVSTQRQIAMSSFCPGATALRMAARSPASGSGNTHIGRGYPFAANKVVVAGF